MATKASFSELFAQNSDALIERLKREQAEQLSEIDDRALVWLALAPSWTLGLARACGFPSGPGLGIEETFRRMVAARYCVSGRYWPEDDDAAGELNAADLQSFWMPDAARTEVLRKTIQGRLGRLTELRAELREIGRRITDARAAGVPFPDGVGRWATMAAMAGNRRGLAKWLDAKVDSLLDAGEPGELLQWIEMARLLEGLLVGALTVSIGRAVRRLELHHRLADDKRRLDKFLERAEQVGVFNDLISGEPDGPWALHYIGSGGMGKTMLIRHLTANLAPRLNLSTARVDFDYLNPDYPARAPGLLMAQLAEELRVYDRTGAAADLFAAFIEKVLNLHERLGAEAVWSQFTLDAVMGPVYEALPLFTEAAAMLPQPVVIILDTCEELSKIRVDGAIPPSVEATFGLLERLHEMLPGLRVIFGGRRALARAGAGWVAPTSKLPPRPYLRAHEILGFTPEEAGEYLRRIEGVREDAVAPVLEHAAEAGDRRQLRWAGQGKRPASPEPRRYNPFDLSLYAAWLREDADLALEAIRTGDADRYIEMRIVRRLKHPDLLALLPALALMGRCDYNVLRAFSGLQTEAFNGIFVELSNLEWVTRQSAKMIEVDRGLRPRLLAYLRRTRPQELEAARRTLVAHLEQITVAEELARLDVSHFSTTFRLLGPEPERALAWWGRVERRFADEQAYDWLKSACECVMGEEEDGDAPRPADAAAPAASLLRAAVRASYAAAMIHVGPFDKIGGVWAEALAYAAKHPAPEQSERLVQRARAGGVAAAARYCEAGPDDEQVRWLWETLSGSRLDKLDTQAAGSLVAAAEAVIEFVEARRKSPPAPEVLSHFADVLGSHAGYLEPACFASALAGRLWCLAGKRAEGIRWLQRAARYKFVVAFTRASDLPAEEAGTSPPGKHETAQTWLDWLAPAHIPSRVCLELIRHAYPVLGASEVLGEIGDRIPEPTNVDSDRLGSAVIELRGAGGFRPTEAWSKHYFERSRYGVQHAPACFAHRGYPPLFARVAEAAAAQGAVDEVIDVLQRESIVAESAVTQFASVQEADRALLCIVKRMRLHDEGVGVSTSLQNSNELQDIKLLWSIGALGNANQEITSFAAPPSSDGGRTKQGALAFAHERYRTTRAQSPAAVSSLADWMSRVAAPGPPTPDASYEELQWHLDRVEMNECSRRVTGGRPFPRLRAGSVRKTELGRAAAQPSIERLTLLLRIAALDESKDAVSLIDKELVAHVGYRCAARIALEEGELLALRLPDRAARLLDQSHRWFGKAKDPVGAYISKVCSALASARAGNNASLSRALTRIQKDYAAGLSKAVNGLPRWSALKALAENPREGLLNNFAARGWRPWLLRLVCCLAWQADGYRAGARAKRLVNWLNANYGAAGAQAVTLPAEFEGWLSGEPAAAAQSDDSEMAISIRRATRDKTWGVIKLVTDVKLALRGRERQFEGRGFVEGLLPYASAAKGLFTSLGESDPELPKVITALAGQSVIELRLDQHASWVCWEAIIGLGIQDLLGTKGEWFHFRRRVEQSRTRRFASWERVKHAVTLTSDLHVAGMAKAAWARLVSEREFEWLTMAPGLLRSASGVDSNPGVLHVVGAPTETSAGVRLDMSPERRRRQGTRGIVGGTLGSSGFGGGHGAHGPTGGGWGGSGGGGGTGGGGTGGGTGGGGSGSGSSGGRSGTSDRGELVKAENLFSLMPNMAMCILQATPHPGPAGERTQSEREQAGYLRHLGAELFRLGVPVVVTVPSLPAHAALEVLRTLLDGFHFIQGGEPKHLSGLEAEFPGVRPPGGRWGTAEAALVFLKALAVARAQVAASRFTSDEGTREAAFDLSIYAADVKV